MASTTKAHMTTLKNKTRALGKRRKEALAKNGSTPGVVSTTKSWVAVRAPKILRSRRGVDGR